MLSITYLPIGQVTPSLSFLLNLLFEKSAYFLRTSKNVVNFSKTVNKKKKDMPMV